MRVLVTGSDGFVGRHIVGLLARSEFDVVGLDRSAPKATSNATYYIQCDVTDGQSLSDAVVEANPDAVVHAAAITPADDEVDPALEILKTNQLSTLTLLLACNDIGCRRFVFLSSAGVYQDPESGTMLTEDSPVRNCGGLYAQTKLGSERLCSWASRKLGLVSTSLRIGPAYGEHERPTGSRERMSPIYRAVDLASNAITIRCNAPDMTFDWIHGDDVGHAVRLVLEAGDPDRLYNVAGRPVTMRETLEAVRHCAPPARIEWTDNPEQVNLPVPTTPRPVSSRRIDRHLGFKTRVDLESGLSRVFAVRAST